MCAFLGEGAEDGFFFAGGGGGGERVGVLDEQVAEVEGVGLRFTVVGRGCCCCCCCHVVVGFVWTVRETGCESVWFLRTKVSKLLMGLSPIWPCAASESGPQRWVLTATRQG